MQLHEILSIIQAEFKCGKNAFNNFGKYNFRKAEDILEALKPFIAKYKVYFKITEDLSFAGDRVIIHSKASICNGKDEPITAVALVGVDFAQKGMQQPQQFGSASSYGKKYALGNLLLIDDTQDADATNTHGNDNNRFKKPQQQAGDTSSLGF